MRPVLVGRDVRPRRQRFGVGHVRRVDVLVLEALDLADRPDHGVEHGPALLADMATRWASTVRPARSGVTSRSTGAKDATER